MDHTDDDPPAGPSEPEDHDAAHGEGPRPLVRRTTPEDQNRPAGGRSPRLRERLDLRAGLAALVLLVLPTLVFALIEGAAPAVTPGTTATGAGAPALSSPPAGTASGGTSRSDGAPGRPPATSPAPTTAEVSACPSPQPAAAATADVDGDGCGDAVTVLGARIEAVVAGERVAYTVGGPGDQVLIGDWDCDGRSTPGVYRPAAGAFFTYDSWPADETGLRPERRPAPRSGTADVRRRGGCDVLHVTAG